ncbi:hypothetical protein CCMA1212_000297 [Trichoderma ghanense]|uniref:Uncharacterized protein n=1 Tax=Trichoderma ghanense TaxID=65468 RepID=A0ABY2HF07_9HYPO
MSTRSQRELQHLTAPAPIGTVGFLRSSYKDHLSTWLRSQSPNTWQPSMLASKLGRDIELQIVREPRPFDVANLMRAVTDLHAEIVWYKRSTHSDQHRVWRDVMQYANPAFVLMRPRFREMLEEEEGVVVTKDDFLDEFDRFAREEDLDSKVVVLMNCPECERWDKQNFYEGYQFVREVGGERTGVDGEQDKQGGEKLD